MLTTDLSRFGDLEVIATQRLYDLLALAGRDPDEPLDRAALAAVFEPDEQPAGSDIEQVAAETPEKIFTVAVAPDAGLQDYQARQLAFGLGLDKKIQAQVVQAATKWKRVALAQFVPSSETCTWSLVPRQVLVITIPQPTVTRTWAAGPCMA